MHKYYLLLELPFCCTVFAFPYLCCVLYLPYICLWVQGTISAAATPFVALSQKMKSIQFKAIKFWTPAFRRAHQWLSRMVFWCETARPELSLQVYQSVFLTVTIIDFNASSSDSLVLRPAVRYLSTNPLFKVRNVPWEYCRFIFTPPDAALMKRGHRPHVLGGLGRYICQALFQAYRRCHHI